MPGYILHLAEAEILIHELKKRKYDMAFSEHWKAEFRCGCLLPDAVSKEKKFISHFWNSTESEAGIMLPNIKCFVDKYFLKLKCIEKYPEVFGYYIHLYLDRVFFDDYLKSCVSFIDDTGNTVEKYSDAKTVQILKSGERLALRRLFSQEYLYGDYTKLNQYLVHKYSISISKIGRKNAEKTFEGSMDSLMKRLAEFLKCSDGTVGELRVLELKSLEKFLLEAALAIMRGEQYYEYK